MSLINTITSITNQLNITITQMHVTNIIYLLLIVLIPIIPAFIFFKFLPGQADVDGPFKGLKIKLTGAFAGYFLIFIILIYIIKPLLISTNYSEKIDFEINGRAVHHQQPVKNVLITANEYCQDTISKTKRYKTDSNGQFKFNFYKITKDAIIELIWEDPKGQELRRRFSPIQASNDIVFENQ